MLNRGGPDYFFRLRIGDFPLVTVPVPLAAQRGQKVPIQFAGPALAGAQPVTLTAPTDRTVLQAVAEAAHQTWTRAVERSRNWVTGDGP